MKLNVQQRKLRAGIVGGGRGSFIGGVHRIAAELDGQAEVVAGGNVNRPTDSGRICSRMAFAEIVQQLRGDGRDGSQFARWH